MVMLQFIFIFISSVSLAINIALTNQFDFSTTNDNKLIKQDMILDFIDFNIQQCIKAKDCIYDHLAAEKIYALELEKCTIEVDNKKIFVLYTNPSLSLYVPLNNTNQDNNVIINYQTLDHNIRKKCFSSTQDDNLVLGLVSK